MLLLQKSLLCKLGIGGNKCECNYNKLNIFIKASSSSVCIGESNKQEAKLKDAKAFGKHYAKRKSIKLKHGNLKSRRIIYPNPNPKGIACNYCNEKGYVKAKFK